MNPLGIEAQRVGKCAQDRVERIAQSLGYPVQYIPELDYGGKTDLVIAGMSVQVSVDRKSNKQQKLLQAREIYSIVAGDRYTDNEVATQINLLFIEA